MIEFGHVNNLIINHVTRRVSRGILISVVLYEILSLTSLECVFNWKVNKPANSINKITAVPRLIFLRSHSKFVPAGAAILKVAGATRARKARTRTDALVETNSSEFRSAWRTRTGLPFLGMEPAKKIIPIT